MLVPTADCACRLVLRTVSWAWKPIPRAADSILWVLHLGMEIPFLSMMTGQSICTGAWIAVRAKQRVLPGFILER